MLSCVDYYGGFFFSSVEIPFCMRLLDHSVLIPV